VFFVEARYHRSPERAAGQVRYIAHREEGLTDGRPRELYGIGERYRAFRGDERGIRRALRDDARGLRSPVYFRFILTVDNPAAERFKSLDGHLSARVLRDAIDKTFRGTLREAQGVFAIHEHGGAERPAHPHVHALLSPRFQNRMAVHISPARIQHVKERWEREVLAGLQHQERRLQRMRQLVDPIPARHRDRDDRLPIQVLPYRPGVRRAGQLELFPRVERTVRAGRATTWASRWMRPGRRGSLWARDPEKAARRATFRLASTVMPRAIGEVLRRLLLRSDGWPSVALVVPPRA
jgi:hypothetical protein